MKIFEGKPELKEHTIIAIVVSRFHKDITDRLLKSAYSELLRQGISQEDILVFKVAGAWEIPYTARLAVREGGAEGVISLGALIRGETLHFDCIAKEVSRGISKASEELSVPITFGVLTCENREQALERAGGRVGDMGSEAARALIELLSIREELSATANIYSGIDGVTSNG